MLAIITCSGCGVLMDFARVGYERSNSVLEGSLVENKKGLYTVEVPENYLYKQQNAYVLELLGQDMFAAKYTVFTRPVRKLPKEIVNNLDATKEWLVNEYIKSRAKDVPQVLMEEKRTFKNEEAIYFESFFQAVLTETMWGIRVDRNAIGYANIIFYHNDHLYWLYHSRGYEFGKKAEPHVSPKIREKFSKFLSGFSF